MASSTWTGWRCQATQTTPATSATASRTTQPVWCRSAPSRWRDAPQSMWMASVALSSTFAVSNHKWKTLFKQSLIIPCPRVWPGADDWCEHWPGEHRPGHHQQGPDPDRLLHERLILRQWRGHRDWGPLRALLLPQWGRGVRHPGVYGAPWGEDGQLRGAGPAPGSVLPRRVQMQWVLSDRNVCFSWPWLL